MRSALKAGPRMAKLWKRGRQRASKGERNEDERGGEDDGDDLEPGFVGFRCRGEVSEEKQKEGEERTALLAEVVDEEGAPRAGCVGGVGLEVAAERRLDEGAWRAKLVRIRKCARERSTH